MGKSTPLMTLPIRHIIYFQIYILHIHKNKIVEELSEIEKLKIENRLLKAQTKKQQMEIDFLKKLDEIERRYFGCRHNTKYVACWKMH